MKFGVREICEVVLKAKAEQKVGNKTFYKNEPVIYFDSLKTSTMEGSATTVYATGGAGNSRLIAWEGERTVTFTMEDALLSPVSFMILSGAGLIEPTTGAPVYVHQVEQTNDVKVTSGVVTITLKETPYQPKTGAVDASEDFVYVMLLDSNGEVSTEPYTKVSVDASAKTITINPTNTTDEGTETINDTSDFTTGCTVLVDYYVAKESGVQQIEITPDKFGGNYYLEASTLFRSTSGVDLPAEFVIPNCKVQSNFSFSMASTGEPSTFTFALDAFPDYTRFNRTKKVLAAIQILDAAGVTSSDGEPVRKSTAHDIYKLTPKD